MKKLIIPIALLMSFSIFAQDIQIGNLSKDDVEDVTNEFGGNFAHTVVNAPETDGIWGIEAGLVAGTTKSPNFADIVDASGGDGDDLESIYHASIYARAHFPYDFFAEVSFLPEQEISDVKIKSSSFGIGWNFGSFFQLPLDVAIGANRSTGELSFTQDADIANQVPDATINFETTTTVYWAGVSKTFWFFTPYAKIGAVSIDGDLDAAAGVLGYNLGKASESVSLSGTYMAAGANLEFGILKLGLEASQIIDVRRVSAKLALDF